MAANTNPIFALTPKVGFATLTTANTAKDGTGAVSTILTAGASGMYVDKIKAIPLGTNVASVLRVFLNNGADQTSAANNTLLFEKSLPATTLTEVAAQTEQVISIGFAIPAGYKLNVAIATAVAAGWAVSGVGGDY